MAKISFKLANENIRDFKNTDTIKLNNMTH